MYNYPLLGCNSDGIDEIVFDFKDTDHPYSYFDLTKDAIDLVGEERVSAHHVFSTVTHYPPEGIPYIQQADESTSNSTKKKKKKKKKKTKKEQMTTL